MLVSTRRVRSEVVLSLLMTLLPVAVIAAIVMIVATIRYGTLRNAIDAVRGETLIARPEVRSFGLSRPGQKIEVDYSLTNLSSRTIRLLGSRTTCACTVTDRLPKALNPRETLVVRVVLEIPDHRPATSEEARLQQEIFIYTSDPSHPEITLTLVGEVR